MSTYFQKTGPDKPHVSDGDFNITRVFMIMLNKWYLFAISLVAVFFLAHMYLSHTLPVYGVSATILINKDQGNYSLNDQFMKGMGLSQGNQNIQNQIMLLSSRTVTERALKELPFETDFYFKTLRNQLPVYPEVPFEITSINNAGLPRNTEFEVKYLGNNRFSLNTNSKSTLKIHCQISSEDTVKFQNGGFVISSVDSIWIAKNIGKKFYFIVHNKANLTKNYNRRLKVISTTKDGTTIKLSLEGTNRAKDVDFINKLTDIFVTLSLDKKNLEASRRIQFIDDQLVGISDSLSLTENRLQQFRSRNKVMDVSTQGQAIINQSMELENQRARIAVETNYYNYLNECLEKNVTSEVPVAPATMGITDPGLTRLVGELVELQGQLSSKSLGDKNPLQNQLLQRIKNTKGALLETLKGLRQANALAVQENNSQIKQINNQAATLPSTERQLLGMERKFKLNDELYTFLMERRSEQQMQKASNVADNEVIDYATESDAIIVSPKSSKIYLLAWFAGMAIPFLLILLADALSRSVTAEEISSLTDLPVAGKIPHNPFKNSLVVTENPESPVSESFRLLRSRMQFFTKENKSPLILVTSSNAAEGKTFTAMNLALAYSLMGKKTVLIGFDLRRPKIFNDFHITNEKGVTTFLIGKDNLNEVIINTGFKNLAIIPSGPVPPNPSELTALEKTSLLFSSLKNQFDYIIVDSSPIGLVSDTYHLASMADSILLVVRNKKTLKSMFEQVLKDLKINDIKSISLVINDVDHKNKGYGYTYYTPSRELKTENGKSKGIKPGFMNKKSKQNKQDVPQGSPWKSNLE